MEPVRFWAAVEFTAQNGSVEALLSQASAQWAQKPPGRAETP